MHSWVHCKERALKHQLTRAIHLARCNPDYQLKFPNESKDNPKKETRRECHKEASIRILQEHKRWLNFTGTPKVKRPSRWNRNVP